MRSTPTDRLTILLAVACAAACTANAAAHPGQHVGVKITITDEQVTYDILMSADLRNMITPTDYSSFRYSQSDNVFHFGDPKVEKQTHDAYEAYFKDKNAVTIDGVRVMPILGEMKFIPYIVPGISEDPLGYPPDVSFSLVYPCKGRPRQVSMVWDLYPQDPARAAYGLPADVEVIAELDAYDENTVVCFMADEPSYTWHAPTDGGRKRPAPVVATFEPRTIPIPLVSIGLVVVAGVVLLLTHLSKAWTRVRLRSVGVFAAAIVVAALARNLGVYRVESPWGEKLRLPTPAEAAELFAVLQRNVYRAFDYKTESDIYDVLSQSVDGDLLDDVYNEVYRSLILRDQGGAVARVESVDILDAQMESAGVASGESAPAFAVRGRWRVRGVVRHWGHAHARTNEYQALCTIVQRDGKWKLSGIEEMQQERVLDQADDPAVPPRSPPASPF